jgi:hypothetical protein
LYECGVEDMSGSRSVGLSKTCAGEVVVNVWVSAA